MIFRQITHDDLGCASYLIGDEDAGVAAVVDPKLESEEYLTLARLAPSPAAPSADACRRWCSDGASPFSSRSWRATCSSPPPS